MIRFLKFFLFFIVTAVTSCTPDKEVDLQELKDLVNGPNGHNNSLWRGIYYCGSKDYFHYLCIKRTTGRMFLKLKVKKFPMPNKMNYTKNENDWLDVSPDFVDSDPKITTDNGLNHLLHKN